MTLKRLATILSGAALAFCSWAWAQNIELKVGYPKTYIVKEGDTLWDVSARFLTEPWRWQEIWDANPQVKNPNLIYPGEELTLVFRDGQPRLIRNGDRPTIKLSPTVRELPSEQLAVPTIPINAVQQFLTGQRLVTENFLNAAPYVVSLGKEHIVAGAGDRLYARGFVGSPSNRYLVYRLGSSFVDPDRDDVVLGHEALYIADVSLEAVGDPATLVVTKSTREILPGDRLLPATDDAVYSHFYPNPPSNAVEGRIISVGEGVTQVGRYQVVVVNLGTRDGIDKGDVMAVYQAGHVTNDKLASIPQKRQSASYIELDPNKQGGIDGLSVVIDRIFREIQEKGTELIQQVTKPGVRNYQTVTLPEERAGLVMVFHPYEHLSYALVMDAIGPLYLHDSVRNP